MLGFGEGDVQYHKPRRIKSLTPDYLTGIAGIQSNASGYRWHRNLARAVNELDSASGPCSSCVRPVVQGGCGDSEIPPSGLVFSRKRNGTLIERQAIAPICIVFCEEAEVVPGDTPMWVYSGRQFVQLFRTTVLAPVCIHVPTVDKQLCECASHLARFYSDFLEDSA
jgi:hypothetical protein